MGPINRVVLIGNLTRDPELKDLPSGARVCRLRIAVADRRKVNGEWVDLPGYYDVSSWGGQAESCAKYLTKGSKVAVDGRLEWHEWEASDGSRRQGVEIHADNVAFMDGPSSRTSAELEREEAAVQ
jgi:single-strand DNA-binding protein